jgi:O-antigen ligase
MLYLASIYGHFRLKFVYFLGFFLLALALLFWNTPDTAPWCLQRLDLNRGSVQHRLAAWRAGFEIMHDHPFGVGWNNTIEIYQQDYSPPEGSALAITTNDYLMLGTQLGIPALLCFITYVALCFGAANCWRKWRRKSSPTDNCGVWTVDPLKVACLSAALSLLVAFWFDHGLFDLSTAAVFWILLELGAYDWRTKVPAEVPANLIGGE